jgi:hypothetical protein
MEDVNIKEGKMTISFCLHKQLDVLMNADKVLKEVNQAGKPT